MAKRGPLLAVLAIGIGLAAAPAAFQMFARAPEGGIMIDEFKPFMTAQRLDAFEGHLSRIGAAVEELQRAGGPDSPLDKPLVKPLAQQWPAINADMSGMLGDIRVNLDNFEAVAALPPFPLFPWFFLAPGLLLAGLAAAALRSRDAGQPIAGRDRWGIIAVGLGLVAAPLVFQMFTRAPLGGAMISDFAPLMTEQRIQTVQGYFLTIGAAEGALRTEFLPTLAAGNAALPAVHEFVAQWPAMAADLAPMIGAMSDNLDNYAAVAALPPFDLFPWFFVIPGVLVAALGIAAADPKRVAAGEAAPTSRSSS